MGSPRATCRLAALRQNVGFTLSGWLPVGFRRRRLPAGLTSATLATEAKDAQEHTHDAKAAAHEPANAASILGRAARLLALLLWQQVRASVSDGDRRHRLDRDA